MKDLFTSIKINSNIEFGVNNDFEVQYNKGVMFFFVDATFNETSRHFYESTGLEVQGYPIVHTKFDTYINADGNEEVLDKEIIYAVEELIIQEYEDLCKRH